jgi:DNA-binding XRE family transcriptional regulator
MGSSRPSGPGAGTASGTGQGTATRRCQACSTPLAADNTARLCGRCHRELRDQIGVAPTRIRGEFFQTDEFVAAFESQHIGRVFKAYRNHPRYLRLLGKALNQEVLGRWLGLTQAQVSKLENGKAEHNLETLRNYAKVLCLPPHMLWFDLPGQTRLKSPAGLGGDSAFPASAGVHVVERSPSSGPRISVPAVMRADSEDIADVLARVRNSPGSEATS